MNWARHVTEYIEAHLDISEYDVVYTTSGPLSSHMVGAYLKNKYNMPWVADFRDLWIGNPYSYFDLNKNIWHKLLYKLEDQVVNLADKVIDVSEEWQRDHRDMFNISASKSEVITNGYDEEDFKNLKYKREKNDKFTIAYSGLIYIVQRSMEPVFKAINGLVDKKQIQLQDVCIYSVGNAQQAIQKLALKYNLQDCIKSEGYVEFDKSNQICVDADLLLCLVGDDERYKGVHTGKIFNYLRSGVPILALAPKNSVLDRLLSENKHGIVLQSYKNAKIEEYILEKYKEWQASDQKNYYMDESIKKYERKALTRKLANIFEEIACQEKTEQQEIASDIYDELYTNGGLNGNYF